MKKAVFLSLSPRLRAALLAGSLAAASVFAACAREGTATPPAAGTGGDLPEVLATVGEEQIKLADLGEQTNAQLQQLEAQYLRNRSQLIEASLEETVRDRMLQQEARRQGKSAEEIIAAEAGGFDVSDVEISTWFTENRARLGGRSLDQVRDQIADFLRNERRNEAAARLEERLRREFNVATNFQPYRITFNNEGAPTLGTSGAPVEVVEYSDFQCPFCQRFAPTLKQLADSFPGQVHIVYKQFPITSIHPQAFKASEASLCANEQGKFWELHDLLFQEQNRLMIADLKEKARRVGLDGRRFDSCLDSGKYTQQVQRELEEGQRAGVNGTPAVFINGTNVPGGAVPFETVAAAVRKELDRIQTRAAQ